MNVSQVQNIYQISKKDIQFNQKNGGSEYGYPNKKKPFDKNSLQKPVKGLRNASEQESKSFDQVDVQ